MNQANQKESESHVMHNLLCIACIAHSTMILSPLLPLKIIITAVRIHTDVVSHPAKAWGFIMLH